MKPIRRHLQVAAIVAALAVPVVTTSGCGLTFSQDIALANGAVSVVQMLVTAIQGWERNYYTANPNPDQQSKIEKLIASTLAADALVAEAIQTTRDAKSEQVSAAFADLMVDYQDLLTLLRDAGVVSAPAGSNLTAEPLAGRLYVLAPEDILPSSVDAANVKAKVGAKRAARARANDLALRSPGSELPPSSPGAGFLTATSDGVITAVSPVGGSTIRFDNSVLTGDALILTNAPRVEIQLRAGGDHPAICDDGMHSLSVFFPGAICVRDGLTTADVMRLVRAHCADMGGCEVGFPGDSPWSGALIEAAHAKVKLQFVETVL